MKPTQQPHPTRAEHASLAVNRRQFLRGIGTGIALPALAGIAPTRLLGAEPDPALRLAATTTTGAPLRFAVVYFPNGAIPSTWWPKSQTGELELNKTHEPLQNVRNQLQILGGLDHVNATPGPDGAGDHARASGTFLTGVRVKKTAGSDIRAGVSIDQLIAERIGKQTRFPSLELSCDAVRKSGNCDSGYSCAYQYNLAWRSTNNPVAPEPNPRLLFERLFGAGNRGERAESFARRQQQQKSILDFVLEDARSLQRQLPTSDRHKLDEYLTSVRAIESRIQRAEQFGKTPDPDVATPDGVPAGFEDYIQVMFDLLFLAFQTDSTRVATFLLANEGSNRAFPEIGIAEGHHHLTHHMNKQDMIDKVSEIDRFYVKQLGRFLDKMQATKETDGNSLLHNSMILYGSGNSDGNRHTHTNLPLILAGAGGGSLHTGRFHNHGNQPMSNLLLSLADQMGAKGIDRLGDSTGRLSAI